VAAHPFSQYMWNMTCQGADPLRRRIAYPGAVIPVLVKPSFFFHFLMDSFRLWFVFQIIFL
jgi:hypothetical protein